MDKPRSEEGTPTLGDKFSPYAKALMKVLGGDPRSLTMSPEFVRRWGYDRQDSVLHLIPDEHFVDLIIRIPPELLDTKEADISQRFEAPLDRIERRARIAFWDEYETALSHRRTMELDEVAKDSGAGSWVQFVESHLSDPYKLAWFMRPPAEYVLRMKEAHEIGMEKLTEIMSLPIVDPKTGKVNVGVGMLILNAIKMADQRLHGAITQKILQLQMKGESIPENAQGMDMAAVEAELKRIEAKLKSVPRPVLQAEPKIPRIEKQVSSEVE